MANRNLPNCDASLTPAWKPYPFPRTKLLDAIKTNRLEGYADRYAGFAPEYWCASGGRTHAAHGGFCATVLMTTARQYYQDVLDRSGTGLPTGLHVEFIEPMPKGVFHIVLRTRQKGNHQTVVQAELVPEDPHSNTVYSTAFVRLGSSESNHIANRQPKLARLPDRDKDCCRWTDAAYYIANPPTSSIRVFCPNDRGNPFWSEKFGGQNCRYQWTKPDQEPNFTFEYLPVLADLV
ncbi:unnamed protein product [Clonostachys rosea]|uniref:Acyl-CoA thioesterase-like N-terminal HotDog domain-containing protein n=1 Tax=Bionectria ochroleuca TaxID=29856 RepID=A0ABY6UFW6_BIOOC|nr:unnamed protein product [Clonostachys rosea]